MGYVSACSSPLSGVGYVSACSSPLSGVGFVTGSLVVVSSFSGVAGLESYFLQTLGESFVFVHIKNISSRQIIEQPSSKKNHKKESLNLPSFLFPSSQFSVPSIIPFPQSKIILIFF